MTTSTEHRRPDVELVDVGEVLVAVDPDACDERPVGVGSWLASTFGARVDIVGVVPAADRGALHRLEQLAARHPCARARLLVGDHPADVLAAEIGAGDRVLGCLASRGRNRWASITGSVATDLLGQLDHPLVLVGPQAAVQHRPGPVVVAVDGRDATDDGVLLAVGAGWARALGRTAYVATVAEPAPPPLRRPDHGRRARGPELPEVYLAELRHDVAPDASATVVYDPVSVVDGLRALLHRLRPSLVVVGTHRHRGVGRLLLGDHAAAVVHDAPAPALVVPLGLRR